MKQYLKTHAPLLIILALCVAVSLGVIFARMGVESRSKTYDIVLDYAELEKLAEQSEHDIAWWLSEFKKMGINKVGLQEESLSSLQETSSMSITDVMMDALMRSGSWRSDYPDAFLTMIDEHGFDRYDLILKVTGEESVDFILSAIKARFPAEKFFYYVDPAAAEETLYLMIDGTVDDALYRSAYYLINHEGKGFTQRLEIESSQLMYLSIGLMPEKVELLQSLGMEIIPRTLCYHGHNGAQFAQAVLDGYAQYGLTPQYIIAGGEAVIGFDEGITTAKDYILNNDITIGLIENASQRENIMQAGIEEIALASDLNTVRIFSVWDYIQNRYAYYGYEGAEEIENTLFRAIIERNIRLIYFKPIKFTDSAYSYVTDIEVYRDMFEGLNERLAAHNINMGEASIMENYQIPSLAILAIGLGAGIGGAMLPAAFLPMKRKWILMLAGAAAVCVGGAWFVAPNAFRLVASFANAVVFACLAALFMLRAAKSTAEKLTADAKLTTILPRACAILVISVLISLVGALMTAAPLSSTDFMLELGIFRGVKLAQLAPLAFFCVLFVATYGIFQKERRENTLKIGDLIFALNWTIPVWAIVVVAVVGVVGYYYIARTGHETSVAVSDIELMLRNFLEEKLLARPRTKEFLIAFPCIMLAVYSAVRRLPFFTAIFGLAGTIGLTSVCNTFMHIRTPLYLGFLRTAYSVILGILIGAILVIVFDILCRIWNFVRKKYLEAELS